MSSSSERGSARVLRGATATVVPTPELRKGRWTRLGGNAVLGDEITETALGSLAESVRAAARAEGYAVGWAEGRRAADRAAGEEAERAAIAQVEAELRREHDHQLAATRLHRCSTALEESIAQITADIEDRALALARELTGLIVGHELRLEDAADVVRRALLMADAEPAAVARMHPSDASSDAATQLVAARVRVLPDPGLSPGDVVVETDQRVLDGRIAAAVARVAQVLS